MPIECFAFASLTKYPEVVLGLSKGSITRSYECLGSCIRRVSIDFNDLS